MITTRTPRWALAGAAVLLATLLLACIKIGGPEPVLTPVVPTPTPFPPTPTPLPPMPTPSPKAVPAIVDVRLCRGLTEDGHPFAETNTFSELDPFVVSIQVADFSPQNIVSAHWYQQDAVIGLTERDNVSGTAYIGLTLEPQTRWVPGDYTLEVSLDGDLREIRTFSVIGMAALPMPGGGGDKGGSGGGTTTTEWQLYREDDLGFSLEYPASWLVEKGGAAVQFAHPKDIAMALVLVDTEAKSSAEQEAEAVFDALSTNLHNAQRTSSKAQDDDWHGVFFTYQDNGTEAVGVILAQIAGSRGYNLVFLAVREQWESIVPTLEQIWTSFEVSGKASGVSGTDEVRIVGLIRDADTATGIPNAVFAILQEGVTVQQFIDSGNDESLLLDSTRSDPDGGFKGNIAVRRGATYAVFAVAKGYTPVVDTMTVPQEGPNPWQITVTMQKE